MLKRVLLVLVIGLFLLSMTGCDKKKEDSKKEYVKPNAIETAKNGKTYRLSLNDQRYVDKSSIVEGIYLKDVILNRDNSAYHNDCVNENNCDSFRGTYYFNGDNLIINYHEKCHTEEEWVTLEEDISVTYRITAEDVFQTDHELYEIVS